MAKVLGVGGVFFKAKDHLALRKWYQDHLGIENGDYGASFPHNVLPADSMSVFTIFPATSKYYDGTYMINLIVDDAEAVLAKAVGGGAHKAGEVEKSEYGTFAWFHDPEGNKIELWEQPKK